MNKTVLLPDNPQSIKKLFTRIKYLKTSSISFQPSVKEWIIESGIEKEPSEVREYIVKEIYKQYNDRLDECLKTPFEMNPWREHIYATPPKRRGSIYVKTKNKKI